MQRWQEGDSTKFQAILSSLNNSQRSGVCRYAEVNGRTLLLRACAVGSVSALELLLRGGADATRLSRTYGSALHAAVEAAAAHGVRHARTSYASVVDSSVGSAGAGARAENGSGIDFQAVIDVLLREGADPFLENLGGHHCVDLLTESASMSTKLHSCMPFSSSGGGAASLRQHGSTRACLLRQLEAAAPFCGLVRVQLVPFSSRDWALLWLAVNPRRYSQPYGSAPKSKSNELWAFASEDNCRPIFRVELDGCLLLREGSDVLTLQLLPSDQHRAFNSTFMRCCMETGREQWLLNLRPAENELEARDAFAALVAVCSSSSSGEAPGGSAAAAGTGRLSPGMGRASASTTYARSSGRASVGYGARLATQIGAGAAPAAATVVLDDGAGRGLGGGPGAHAASSDPQHVVATNRNNRRVRTHRLRRRDDSGRFRYPGGGGRMVLPIAFALAAEQHPPALEGRAAELMQQAEAAAEQLGLLRRSCGATAADQAPELAGGADVQAQAAAAVLYSVPPVGSVSGTADEDVQQQGDDGGDDDCCSSTSHSSGGSGCQPQPSFHAAPARDSYQGGKPAGGIQVEAPPAVRDVQPPYGCSCTSGLPVQPEVQAAPPESQPCEAPVEGPRGEGLASCVVCMANPAVLGLKHGRSVHHCVCYGCIKLVIRSAEGPGGAVRCPLCRQLVDEVLAVF